MRRPSRGATTRPGMPRPGYGFGRPLKPRPQLDVSPRPWLEPEWWSAIDIHVIERSEKLAERS
jgi:hypothetical protein